MPQLKNSPEPLPGARRGEGKAARAAGAFVAFAAADALGWPQEMRPKRGTPSLELRAWVRQSGGRFKPHEEPIQAGEYSDDTQLLFAVGRARLTGSAWAKCLSTRELPFFHLYNRGAGRSVLRACRAWRKGTAPWLATDIEEQAAYFQAGANGAAMRVLPHVAWHSASDDETGLFDDVFADGILTHGHPRALLGASLFAHAARLVIRNEGTLAYGELVRRLAESADLWAYPAFMRQPEWLASYERSMGPMRVRWEETVREILALLRTVEEGLARGALADDQAVLSGLGCFGKFKGSGTITAAAAIYLASRYAAQPTGGVISAAFAFGADTDTLAAMTGGLLGALHGRDWMPSQWLRVQDCAPLEELASQLVQRQVIRKWHPVDDDQLSRLVETMGRASTLSVDGELLGDIVAKGELLHRGEIAVDVWKVRLNDGQSIYLKRFVDRVQTNPKREKSSAKAAKSPVGRGIKTKLKGVRLGTHDVDGLATFYEHLLGVPASRADGELKVGPFEIARSAGATRSEPVWILETTDVDAVAMRLHSFGARELERSGDASISPWVRVADPAGNVIEIVEAPQKK